MPHSSRTGLTIRAAVTAAAAAALAVAGCQQADPGPTATLSGAGTTPSTVETTRVVITEGPLFTPTAGETAGPLPDVCTLLSKGEASGLVGGRAILAVDPDNARPDATVRFCQWQMSGARLAVQLSPTTPGTFGQDHAGATAVPALGDQAHFFSNHLFVRKGNVQIDVYASTSEGPANDKLVAKATAEKIFPRL